jgi:hypothetical protein
MVLKDGEEVTLELKLVDDRRYVRRLKVNFKKEGNRIWLMYPFSKLMNAEIKGTFVGYKWHGFDKPAIKKWSIEDCEHNWFQILYLADVDVYGRYRSETSIDFELPRDNLYAHQRLMAY